MNTDPKSMIAVDGLELEASTVAEPSGGRTFRDAWAAGDAETVYVDMDKARTLYVQSLRREREAIIAELVEEIANKRFLREDTSEAEAKLKRYEQPIDPAAPAKIRDAQTVEDLLAVTLDDYFPQA